VKTSPAERGVGSASEQLAGTVGKQQWEWGDGSARAVVVARQVGEAQPAARQPRSVLGCCAAAAFSLVLL